MGWFGTLPKHWETHRIKTMFELRDERNFLPLSEVNLLSLYTAIGVKPRSQMERISGNVAVTADNYKKVYVDDIVVNIILCWQGAVGVSKWDGVTSPAYDVYKAKSKQVNVDYYNYLFRMPSFSGECYKAGHGIMAMRWRTYSDEFGAILVPLPPLTEQDQIVRYLDWKVSGINRLINAKKKQVLLLQEKKQAIINASLNEDKSDRWINKPLKYWVKSNLESLSSNTDPDYEFDYLDISSVGHGFVKQRPVHMSFSDAPSRARRVVEYGDTIISTVRTYLRSVCFIDHDIENCIVSTGFSVLHPKENSVMPELLSFALSADTFVDAVIMNSTGVSYPAINDTKLLNIKVSLPQLLEEQELLYSLINEQFASFDILIAKIKKQISSLIEYRTRLISDVVTGKQNVRGVVVPEYEAVEEAANTIEDDLEETEGGEE